MISRVVPGSVRLLMWVSLVSLVSGCGWQLRGVGGTLDVELPPVYVIAGVSSPLVAAVTEAIADENALAERRSTAQWWLEVSNPVEDRRAVSFTSNVRTAEYELTATMSVRISTPDGEEILPDTRLQVERVFELDRENITGASAEQRQLREELRVLMSQQVLRLLAGVSRQQEAQATP